MNCVTIGLFRAFRFIPHEPREHSFYKFTMIPTKTLSIILWEKLFILTSRSHGQLTLFDVLIIAHVISPTAELLYDSDNRELNWKILAGFSERNMMQIIYFYCKVCWTQTKHNSIFEFEYQSFYSF